MMNPMNQAVAKGSLYKKFYAEFILFTFCLYYSQEEETHRPEQENHRQESQQPNRMRRDSDIAEALAEGDFEVSSWASVQDTESDDSEPEEHPVLKKNGQNTTGLLCLKF